MNYKKGFITFLIFICGFFHVPDLFADNLSYLICHGSLNGNFITQNGGQTNLYVDSEKYTSSVHKDLECTLCHLRYQDNPHRSINETIDPSIQNIAKEIQKKSPIDPVALAACVQCHEEIYQQVRQSVHGKNIFEKKEADGALCLDCHGSPHEIVSIKQASPDSGAQPSRVAYEKIVATCGRCHEEKNISVKYGLSTEIVKRYNESFHGKKYHLGGKNLPVCTTCHGAHDIRSHKDPASPVYGDNKIALCGQCHKGANREFVAAITHKPMGKDNPIPYYSEKGLIVLTFCVIGGCALHVIFQIVASIRDALRRRRRMAS